MCAKEKRRKGKGRAHAAANKRQIYSGQRQSRKHLKHGFVYRIDSITLATPSTLYGRHESSSIMLVSALMNPSSSSISSRWSGVVAHLIFMPIALIRLISILIKGPNKRSSANACKHGRGCRHPGKANCQRDHHWIDVYCQPPNIHGTKDQPERR